MSLENTGLDKRVAELEVDLLTENAAKGALEKDVSWILSDRLSRVVDRLIESSQFLQGLVLVKEACVAAGVEQGKKIVWEQVSAGEVDRKSEENVAVMTQEMEDAIVTFTKADFVSYLLLGALDVDGLRNLC